MCVFWLVNISYVIIKKIGGDYMEEILKYLKEMEERINSKIKQTENNLKDIIEASTIKNADNHITVYKKLDNIELEISKMNIALLENQLAVAKLKLIK
jgi:hypothetical protein